MDAGAVAGADRRKDLDFSNGVETTVELVAEGLELEAVDVGAAERGVVELEAELTGAGEIEVADADSEDSPLSE